MQCVIPLHLSLAFADAINVLSQAVTNFGARHYSLADAQEQVEAAQPGETFVALLQMEHCGLAGDPNVIFPLPALSQERHHCTKVIEHFSMGY